LFSGGFGGWRQRVLNPTVILRFFCIIALAIALFSPIALAQEAETDNIEPNTDSLSKYQINMYIAYNKVLVESAMLFSEEQTTNFSIELPLDAREIINEVDKFEYPAILDSNNLLFYLNENKYVKYSYITEDMLERNSFIASMTVPFDTENLRIKLALPEKAILEKPLRNGAVAGSSVYPQPKILETDGQAITVVWEFDDLKKDEEIALYVKYREPADYITPLIFIISSIIILLIILYMLYHSKHKKKAKTRTIIRDVKKPESGIEKHLKEDEEQVINVLKLKEGRCEQGTLRIATGFSKAKLSGLLKELEERKVIHKEKRGKKNLVFLK
jgi:uncharacterized membrane protein